LSWGEVGETGGTKGGYLYNTTIMI
jgi:hypothetical protein